MVDLSLDNVGQNYRNLRMLLLRHSHHEMLHQLEHSSHLSCMQLGLESIRRYSIDFCPHQATRFQWTSRVQIIQDHNVLHGEIWDAIL